MQVTIVGFAGSFPSAASPASCYLIEADGFRLVLDLGNGALGALQHYTALSDVDAICISHLHADHCIDMLGYSVFQDYHPDGQRPRIPVYGPTGTADRLEAALGSHSMGIEQAFDIAVLTPGTVEIGPLTITAGRMRHPVETFGFRIEHDGQALAYSADTGPADELVALARGADVLLAEASFTDGPNLPPDLHLTAQQAAEHAAAAGVGELVLTHLVAWNDPAVTLEQAAAAYDGPLRLASSGQRLLGASRVGHDGGRTGRA
ncbi:MAG TPA: MBL fold metallo-hydrolase [Streptosporangiaceae bacterium]|nr:MBL fold metallo-hydrolase [Streptosporangiaceae bacterium]